MALRWVITFFIKARMSHRITISLKRQEDGSGDAFHAFGWLRENMRHRYCYLGTTWVDFGNYQHKQIWSSIELPHDGGRLAEFDVYTDPDTRERIMTFEIDDDDDLALVRLRFNEVPRWRNVELDRLMVAREKINAMFEVKDDD